ALAAAPFAIFQGNLFYPAPDVLAFSEHLLGLAPVAAPVFLASGNAVLTYNATILVTVLVTALATWALVRRWTGDGAAAVLAAAVVGGAGPRAERSRGGGDARGGRARPRAGRHPVPAGARGGRPARVRRRARRGTRSDGRPPGRRARLAGDRARALRRARRAA